MSPHRHEHGHHRDDHDDDRDSAESWDRRYAERERRWSGDPNGAMVSVVQDLSPGTALDVGCGEGADAIWLAGQGWTVTAVDISTVAIDRGRDEAHRQGADIDWVVGDPIEGALDGRTFELVSVQYPALAWASEPMEPLLATVAPGGRLLVVGHDVSDVPEEHRHHDPDLYLQAADVEAALRDDPGWTIERFETRPRPRPAGFEGPDMPDAVLLAQRVT